MLWAAFSAGSITEAEAETLSAMIDARAKASQVGPGHASHARVGSRPRSDASMERRRRWAAAGRLPPQIAAQFTMGEQAALAVVAAEISKRGTCCLAIGAIAALAGVSETTVRRALRQARALALVSIRERRVSRFRSETNVVSITSREWLSWLRLRHQGSGCQIGQGTNTRVQTEKRQRAPERNQRAIGMGNGSHIREVKRC